MRFSLVIICLTVISGCKPDAKTAYKQLTREVLQDKIKGGWAGKVIGCTFISPTELQIKDTIFQDLQYASREILECEWYFDHVPDLYDDIYRNLIFVKEFDYTGLNTSSISLAKAFAGSEMEFKHANKIARFNILGGIQPPESGHWMNNPYSDNMDFMTMSDFIGLMSPGMVNAASAICDRVGHIMNYGNGWYGGVYVAAMYSLAFISSNVEYIVTEGLKALPRESDLYRDIHDVIGWWKQYPNNWKNTWDQFQRKWVNDVDNRLGVFFDYDYDARHYAAYIVIGLLYGEGDFGKTLEIASLCGQAYGFNPSCTGGIIGTLLGYDRIPEFWKTAVNRIEDMNFKYTNLSLNDIYWMGYRQALENLIIHGAVFTDNVIEIPQKTIQPVRLEIGLDGLYRDQHRGFSRDIDSINPGLIFDFEGSGFELAGWTLMMSDRSKPDYVFKLGIDIDGQFFKEINVPVSGPNERNMIAWGYELPEGNHTAEVTILNPQDDYMIRIGDLFTYSSFVFDR